MSSPQAPNACSSASSTDPNSSTDSALRPAWPSIRNLRSQTPAFQALYVAGGQLDYMNPQVSGTSQTVDIRAHGFLNLFASRYTDASTYTATDGSQIAASLILTTQLKGANWDFGVTIGSLATTGPHDRTYQQDVTSIKDALQDLTKVQANPFDFEFTADKTLNTYASIGSQRPDVIFEFPGNVKSLSAPLDATGIANQVNGYGSGLGDQATARFNDGDDASQADYKVRQKVLITNATDNSD